MDPTSILAIINGSIGIALKVGSVVNKLYTLSQRLKYAELTIQSLASECETIEAAWAGIEAWARKQPLHYDAEQELLLDRMKRSLLFGTMVFSALEEDLEQFTTQPQNLGFFRRNKVVWNKATFASHQNRIGGQVAAITLLLQAIKLASNSERTELLMRENETLRRSDETAWTIVDSSASLSIRHPESRMSMESSDVVYVRFDFEPELLSGRVYGRSYKYLAEKLKRREGKQPARDVQASLFIREGRSDKDWDDNSVLSVPRFSWRDAFTPHLTVDLTSTSRWPPTEFEKGLIATSKLG